MEKQEQSTSCKHYLRLYFWKVADDEPRTVWVKCQYCKRRWYLGTEDELLSNDARAAE